MNGFRYDGVLFYKAQQNLSSALNLLENNRSNISKCKDSISTVFEYKNQVSEICNNLLFLISDVSTLSRNVSEAKERLISLDSVFAMQYYESASKKFDDLNGRLTQEEKNIIQYNQEQYQKNLCKYLEDLEAQGLLNEEQKKVYEQVKLSVYVTSLSRELEKLDPNSAEYRQSKKWFDSNCQKLLNLQIKELESKGNLTEEEQKQLNSLRDNVKALELDKLQLELDEVNSNPVEMPGVPGGRMTEAQEKAYKKEAEKYGKYYQKKLKLENEIESLQKELGVYENKWYEDIGDAITKTGSAWKNAWETKSFDSVVSATKQTIATGAVVATSAISGLAKVGELAIDGVTILGGGAVSGVAWLVDHETGENLMNGTLDFVRRDLVGEVNQNFYENTFLGNWINENSNLKYDSAGAQAIQKSAKFVTEVVIATAAEIGTLGAATPFIPLLFAAEGAGEAAEAYTQSVKIDQGESYNYAMALGSAALGAFSGAMKGKMYGKIGANTLNILKDPSLIKSGVALLKETGVKKILTNELKSTSFWVDFLTTGIQKGGEVVNEYHQTGNINWGKVFTSFAGELLYARLTDKLTANSIDEIINQKTIFQTMKDVSSTAKNLYSKAKKFGNDFLGKNKYGDFSIAVDSSVSSFIKKSSTDGYFGVSQESTSRYKKFTIEDVDWLSKNSTDLELYLKSKYNLQNAAEYIENWKKTREINDFTKESLEKFIYESNPNNFEDNISLINNLFGVKELPEYVRQKNILIKKGLSEMDSIKLLDSMDNAKFGMANCTYASTANAIFSQFDGKEHEFKKIFGFDMYIEIDGVKRLNGNELILDMYTHMNSSLNKDKYHPGNLLSVNSDGNMKLNDINATRVRANSNSILSEYFNSKGLKNVKLDECTFDLRKLTIDRNNFEKELNINFDGSKSYKLDLRCRKNSDFDFINTKPIDYYDSSGNLLLHMDNSGHSVFITGISNKGVECSSWGKKCYIPFSCFSGNKGVTIMSVNLEV